MPEGDPPIHIGPHGGDDDFGFLKTNDAYESAVTASRKPAVPYVFQLADGQDADTIAAGLRALNSDVICEPFGQTAVSIVMPPDIKVGDKAVDLREVALTLSAASTVKKLGLQSNYEGCCGNSGGAGGCCVNLL